MKNNKNQNWMLTPRKKILLAVIILMLTHFLFAAYFSKEVLGSVPHIPDSAVYYMQGILLNHGKLFLENFKQEPAKAFQVMFSNIENGRMYFKYNHFWPVLLALPIRMNFADLLNPLLSAISLLFVYLIASQLFNHRTGIAAALFYSVSPFIIIMGGSFMLHTPTQLFLLASFYFLLRYLKKQDRTSVVLTGFLLAYGFGLRQLTAVAVALPLLLYSLIFYRKALLNKKSLWFFAGFIIPISAFFIENKLITGYFLKAPHMAFHQIKFLGEGLTTGLNLTDSALGFLPPILFYGLIPMLFISLALIPLIVLRKKEDYLLIAIFISLVAAYGLTNAHGLHGYGPRFFFEALFVFFILAGRTVIWVWESGNNITRTIVLAFLVFIIIYNANGLNTILPSYKDYNYIDSDVVERLKEMDLENSIIVVSSNGWHGMGVTATLWDPDYKKSFFIRKLPDGSHNKIILAHPKRTPYFITGSGKIIPYSSD